MSTGSAKRGDLRYQRLSRNTGQERLSSDMAHNLALKRVVQRASAQVVVGWWTKEPRVKMKTRVERINPYLNVRDLSASISYYVDVLGFELYVETATLGIVQRDGHQIHLSKCEEAGRSQQIWIGVQDVAVLYEQYRGTDAVICEEPRNYPWAYQMVVLDLDDNRLIFGSEPKETGPNQE